MALGIDEEKWAYLQSRGRTPGDPAPQVTPLFFEIDFCTKVLRVPYQEFLRWPRAIRQLYRYYFRLRSLLEDEHEQALEEKKKRDLQLSQQPPPSVRR